MTGKEWKILCQKGEWKGEKKQDSRQMERENGKRDETREWERERKRERERERKREKEVMQGEYREKKMKWNLNRDEIMKKSNRWIKMEGKIDWKNV